MYDTSEVNTVEPLNKGHIGTRSFVLYREVSFINEYNNNTHTSELNLGFKAMCTTVEPPNNERIGTDTIFLY